MVHTCLASATSAAVSGGSDDWDAESGAGAAADCLSSPLGSDRGRAAAAAAAAGDDLSGVAKGEGRAANGEREGLLDPDPPIGRSLTRDPEAVSFLRVGEAAAATAGEGETEASPLPAPGPGGVEGPARAGEADGEPSNGTDALCKRQRPKRARMSMPFGD